MDLDDLVFVTSNLGKLREAGAVLGRALDHHGLDLPELQSLDLHEVVLSKVQAAWTELGRPVMVEDTALEFSALKGFPGPLIRWLLISAGPEGICRIVHAFGDPGATARCLVCASDGKTQVFGEGAVEGEIVSRPRGSGGFGWDSTFAPSGHGGRTYGEMSDDEKNLISHRHQAFIALKEALADR